MRTLMLSAIFSSLLFSCYLSAQPVVGGKEFDAVYPFKGDLTVAWKKGRGGLINKKAETVLPFQYDHLSVVGTYGVVTGNAGIYRFCDLKGQPLIDLALDSWFEANDSLVYGLNYETYTWYIINFSSRKVVTVADTDNFYYNGEGLFKVLFYNRKGWHLLRPDGSFLLSYPLNGAYKAGGGRIVIQDTTGRNRLLNTRGQGIPVPKNWSALSPLTDNNKLFTYQVNEKYGLADSLLHPLLPPVYDWISFIDGSSLLYIQKGKLYGVATTEGKIILPCESPDKCRMTNPAQTHFVLETPGYKRRLVNRQNKTVLPPLYINIYLRNKTAFVQMATGFRFFNLKTETWYSQEIFEDVRWGPGEWFMVKKNGKWGVLTETLNPLVPFEYDELTDRDFGAGPVFEVRKGEYLGILSTDNKVLLPLKYKFLEWSGVSPGCTRVLNDSGYSGVVNLRNEVVIPFQYKGYQYHHTGQNIVSRNNKAGIIDFGGNIIVPFEYESIRRFTENLAAVKLNGKWGFINRKLELVLPCIYDQAESFYKGRASVKKDGRSFYINHKGENMPPAPF